MTNLHHIKFIDRNSTCNSKTQILNLDLNILGISEVEMFMSLGYTGPDLKPSIV